MLILALTDRRYTEDGFEVKKLEAGKIHDVRERVAKQLISIRAAKELFIKRYDDYLKELK